MTYLVPSMQKHGQGASFSQTPPPLLTQHSGTTITARGHSTQGCFYARSCHRSWRLGEDMPQQPPTVHVFGKKRATTVWTAAVSWE